LVPSYSRTRLATASPYVIGILCVLAVASCSIVRKDSNKGSVNKLIEVNWYCNCFTVKSVLEELGSILEVSSNEGNFSCISLRLFCCIRGCNRMEFGACFLFIRGPNKRVFVGCL
jgi:hypothetical protein